jgi:hypothetical protein
VKVRGKGLVVRARKGYYAPNDAAPATTTASAPAGTPAAAAAESASGAGETPKPTDKAALDRDLQQALDSPFPVGDVKVRMTAFVLDETVLGRARTLLAAEVDAANLDFVEKDGRHADTLDVLMVAQHRESGEYVRRDQKLEMAFQPASLARVRQSWYPVVQEFELAPGAYQAKIVVRDGNSRRLGSLTYEFDVPPLSELRVSTPVLTDSVRQREGERVPTPVLIVRRVFAPEGRLYCQFDVYGAEKDKATGLPHVRASYVLRDSEGVPRERGGPLLLSPTSLGRISQLLWLPLEGARAGDYELVLTIRDELTGLEREVRETFTIAAGTRATSASPAR